MAVLLALSPGTWAQTASPTFRITGFDVSGVNPLEHGETTRILAPFLRSDASIEVLQRATAALESALKERGYGLYRVSLPPQELGDVVKLAIVRYVVGKVSVEGARQHGEANIRRSVPELAEGATPNFRTLAVQTAIANESQGKQLQVVIKEGGDNDTIDARIVVKESKPWNMSTSLSNTGSSATGRDRFSLVGGHSNLFDLDHHFSAAYTTSLARPSSVRQLGLNYRVPLYAQGGVLALSHTRSDVVGSFGPFSSTGAGQTFGLSYSHYFAPEGGRRSNLTVAVDDKRFDPTQINGVPVPGQLARRSTPLSLAYAQRVESDGLAWGYNAEIATNLGMGSGNSLSAYQSEDPRIRSSGWTLLRMGGSYLTALGGTGWVLSTRALAQYSREALISGEQFGIGGASSVRGTGERPVSGDSGLFVSIEFTSPEWLPGLRWVGFLDAGGVRSQTAPTSSKLASDSLSGLGFGLRYNRGPFVATAEWARLVKGSKVPLAVNSESPQKGDHKLHVNLMFRF